MSIFSTEPRRRVRRTKFHLNHEVKTTARFGEFTPILCQEVLPGDTWKLQTEQFIRFAPTLAPVMHRINATLHYFFVPNRLLMRDCWETFISPSGFKDEERAELPYLHFDGYALHMTEDEMTAYNNICAEVYNSRYLDHIGINFAGAKARWIASSTSEAKAVVNVAGDAFLDGRFNLPLLPICAYWLIMDEFFLDENQNDIRTFKKCLLELCKLGEMSLSDYILKASDDIDWSLFEQWNDGDHITFLIEVLQLCKRAYEKDYFTSALPDTQRGDEVTIGSLSATLPDMYLPAGATVITGTAEKVDTAPLTRSGVIWANHLDDDKLYSVNENSQESEQAQLRGATTAHEQIVDDHGRQIGGQELTINPVTINELRRAVRLQEFLEKSMRAGYRLIEQIFSHFGVMSSNKLLDRPQFLGGNINPVTVTEITGTAGTDVTHLGEYSGHLQSFGGSRVTKFRSEEHGWLFCFLSVLPRTNYCQGIARQFQRHDRFDFAWPEFAHLGEQEVWMNELYNGSDLALDPHETFGYQSRYAEYKYIPSQVSGDFKTPDKLKYWTLARQFELPPTLSNEFIQCDPLDENNTDIFTVQDDSDYLYCQFYHKILAKRCLPKFGVPML